MGDDLDPDKVSILLGQKPTRSEFKGDVHVGQVTGQKLVAKTGGWRLRASKNLDGDLDAQLVEILGMLTTDLAVWRDLTARFEVDFFCGIFLKTSNDGLSLKASTIQMLGERRLRLELDIYESIDG